MYLGFSKQPLDVSPFLEDGLFLDGYADRKGKAYKSLDVLFVRSLCLATEELTSFFICIDTLFIDEAFQQEIIRSLIEEHPKEKIAVYVCATHTHSAPRLCDSPLMFSKEPAPTAYRQHVLQMTLKVARESWQTKKSGIKAKVSQKVFDGVGANRLDKKVASETPLSVIHFYEDEALYAAMVVYNCHPTTLSAENEEISSDLAGQTLTALESLFGINRLIYFTGAAGDISTRFRRKDQSL